MFPVRDRDTHFHMAAATLFVRDCDVHKPEMLYSMLPSRQMSGFCKSCSAVRQMANKQIACHGRQASHKLHADFLSGSNSQPARGKLCMLQQIQSGEQPVQDCCHTG